MTIAEYVETTFPLARMHYSACRFLSRNEETGAFRVVSRNTHYGIECTVIEFHLDKSRITLVEGQVNDPCYFTDPK